MTTRHRSRLAWAGIVGGLVVLALAVVLGGLVLVRSGTPLPGTSVEGLDVGGLGEADLRAAITRLADQRQDATIEVTAVGQSFSFTPGSEGYGVDVDATMQAALDAGRDGFLGLPDQVAATFGATREVDLQGQPIEEAVERFVRSVADSVDQARSAGSVRVDPETLEVRTRPPRDRVVLDVAASVSAVVAEVGDPDPEAVTLPAEVTPAPTGEDDVADAVARAQRAVSDSLVLTANGASTTLSPSEIATVLRTREREGRLAIVADTDALAELLAADLPSLEVEPTDASYDIVSGFTTFDDMGETSWSATPAELTVVPSEPGELYDPKVAAAQVGRLLDAGTRTAELKLPVAPADFTTEEAQKLLPTELLGTFTTYHACCQTRIINIHRIADIVRGVVVLPGETFSVNDYVGPRTREKGFVPAGAIVSGEIEDEVGGGISQFATTMYNAAFFAGIPTPEHRAHSLYISRYPLAREATLNYDNIDVAITNDTDHAIVLHTSYTGTSLTFSVFGRSDVEQVISTIGEPYGFVDFEVRTEADPSLPRGTEVVVQSGEQGYKVDYTRILDYGDRQVTEEMTTIYRPWPTIIRVGTGEPPPPPPPSPSPTATPTPTPTPDKPDPSPTPTPRPTDPKT